MDDAKKTREDRLIKRAMRVLEQRMNYGPVMQSPNVVREYLALRFSSQEREVFTCLFLDTRHRVLSCEDLFFGTIDGASVHPREIVKRALETNCAAVVIAHNHPSGNPEPSEADKALTRRLQDALGLIDIRILDHLVIGGAATVSFSERGLL
ncbi:MAG: DNA repair protein RadC [Chromatiales bacterium 21-64-14]|nr:MAG: DNA repair protein RadC [Chromatiales bacterium 21-64-14]